MERLTCALVCVLLSSASAGPVGLQLHQDADIRDSDLHQDPDQDWMDLAYTAMRSSSESQSSEESSSEETHITQAPPTEPPPVNSAPPTGVPVAMTTDLSGTDLPTVGNSTAPEPCPTTGCVTVDIPTGSPTPPPAGTPRGDA